MRVKMLCIVVCAFVFGYGEQWYKAQLHCHSTISDGALPPADVVAFYKNAGYSVVCLTDHNLRSTYGQYSSPGMLFLGGIEVNTGEHTNGIGTKPTFGWADEWTAQSWIAEYHREGALAQVNHPEYSRLTASDVAALTDFELLEIMNPVTDGNFTYDLGIWDSLLTRGRVVWGTATDDAHTYPGEANLHWVMIRANALDSASILGSLRTGDFYSSNGPVFSEITMSGRTIAVAAQTTGCPIRFYGKGGVLLKTTDSTRASYSPPSGGTELYVRAELRSATGKLAYTQPFFPENSTIVSDLRLTPVHDGGPAAVARTPILTTLLGRCIPGNKMAPTTSACIAVNQAKVFTVLRRLDR
jgi:hypothetical protein